VQALSVRVMTAASDRVFYAHSRPGEPFQTWERLEWHLWRAGSLARRFGHGFGVGLTAAASGLLHDVGKYSDAFQRRIAEDSGRVDHATGGAREAERVYGTELGRLLAYGIAGHHAGLPNGGNADDSTLLSRLVSKRVPPGHERWEGRIAIPDAEAIAAELQAFVRADHRTFDRFSKTFLARMVFSCLVDADFLATEWFYDRGRSRARRRPVSPAALAPILRAYLDEIVDSAAPTEINRQRRVILEECRAAAAQPLGVFSLDVPTGGGKTLSSLSFALEHAVRHRLARVVYAIPYTSIIEQTADVFRTALATAGTDIVVEHHSAAEVPLRAGDEPIGAEKLRLATENWDAPLVVTTTVQLFESLYGDRPSRCRKLHNLACAVIVLDEVQALPHDRLSACLAALRELTLRYRTTVVLCSATLPNLASDPVLKVRLPRARPIVARSPELTAAFRRVRCERMAEPIHDSALAGRLAGFSQVLCILDARRHAADVFAMLPDDGCRFHLSAAMCPQHRREVLARVRERLAQGLPCRLITTRVIEAGVDISFPVVWRAIAGVDSLHQAAGRCNRNGEFEGLGHFVIFDPAREDAIPKPLADLRRRASEARQVLRWHDDPLDQAAVESFFGRILALDPNDLDRDQCWRRLHEADLDRIPFRDVAGLFRMISEGTDPLIVRWNDEATQLVEKLRQALGPDARPPRRVPLPTLRRLQSYTVGCYGVARLSRAGDAAAIDPEGRFHLLENAAVYDRDTGLDPRRIGLRDPEDNLF
jgi:CRISPR-associated endonuclease/helicase Cas3